MSVDTRIGNNGYLEVKHSETNAWTPAITLLRLAGGFDVKLIPTQIAIINKIVEKLDNIGDLKDAATEITEATQNLVAVFNKLIATEPHIRVIQVLANQETLVEIPDGTKTLAFLVRKNAEDKSYDLKYAFEPGQVMDQVGRAKTLWAYNEYKQSNLYLTDKILYLACKQEVNVEIECYY